MKHTSLSVFDYDGNNLCDLYDSDLQQRGSAHTITGKKERSGQKT